MSISYVEPRSPRILSEEQQQAKGLLGPESAGERWKLRVWSESSVMRCRPLRPSLGAHTPSPPSHFVEIPHRPPLPPPPTPLSGACRVRPNCSRLTEL